MGSRVQDKVLQVHDAIHICRVSAGNSRSFSFHVLLSPGLKLFRLKLGQSLIIYKMHLQYKTNKSWKPVIQNNTELPPEEASVRHCVT
jgi:hypothetical protein